MPTDGLSTLSSASVPAIVRTSLFWRWRGWVVHSGNFHPPSDTCLVLHTFPRRSNVIDHWLVSIGLKINRLMMKFCMRVVLPFRACRCSQSRHWRSVICSFCSFSYCSCFSMISFCIYSTTVALRQKCYWQTTCHKSLDTWMCSFLAQL